MSDKTILFYLTFLKSLNKRNQQVRSYEERIKQFGEGYCYQGELLAQLMEKYGHMGDELTALLREIRWQREEWYKIQEKLQEGLRKMAVEKEL